MDGALTRWQVVEGRSTVNNVCDLLSVGGLVIVPAIRDDCVEGVLVGGLGNVDHGSLA